MINKELTQYAKAEKVCILFVNHRTGGLEWRKGEVLDTGMIYQKNGKPYPKAHVSYIMTYFNAETKEFYEKENSVLVIDKNELCLFEEGLNDKLLDERSVWKMKGSTDGFNYFVVKKERGKVFARVTLYGEPLKEKFTEEEWLKTFKRVIPIQEICS